MSLNILQIKSMLDGMGKSWKVYRIAHHRSTLLSFRLLFTLIDYISNFKPCLHTIGLEMACGGGGENPPCPRKGTPPHKSIIKLCDTPQVEANRARAAPPPILKNQYFLAFYRESCVEHEKEFLLFHQEGSPPGK
jgi:hypothetical protein